MHSVCVACRRGRLDSCLHLWGCQRPPCILFVDAARHSEYREAHLTLMQAAALAGPAAPGRRRHSGCHPPCHRRRRGCTIARRAPHRQPRHAARQGEPRCSGRHARTRQPVTGRLTRHRHCAHCRPHRGATASAAGAPGGRERRAAWQRGRGSDARGATHRDMLAAARRPRHSAGCKRRCAERSRDVWPGSAICGRPRGACRH